MHTNLSYHKLIKGNLIKLHIICFILVHDKTETRSIKWQNTAYSAQKNLQIKKLVTASVENIP